MGKHGKKTPKRRNSSDSSSNINTTKSARHGGSPEAVITSTEASTIVSDILSQTNSVLHGDTNPVHMNMNMTQPNGFSQILPGMQTGQLTREQSIQIPISPVQPAVPQIPAQYGYVTTAMQGPSNTDIMNCLCKIESRLTQFDEKMKTLEKVEKKIDHFDKELNKIWVYVNDNLASNSAKTSQLEDQVGNVELSMGLAQDKLSHLEKENGRLKDSMIDLQARSMRDNLVWGGIGDDPNETNQQTESKIRDFICNELKMDKTRVDEITFERVHRTGTITAAYPKRKIITKFTRFPDKEEVRKLKSRLEGTHYFIHEQFPPEIVAQRRKLMPRLRAAKSDGKRAWISYNRLFIDGQPVNTDSA